MNAFILPSALFSLSLFLPYHSCRRLFIFSLRDNPHSHFCVPSRTHGNYNMRATFSSSFSCCSCSCSFFSSPYHLIVELSSSSNPFVPCQSSAILFILNLAPLQRFSFFTLPHQYSFVLFIVFAFFFSSMHEISIDSTKHTFQLEWNILLAFHFFSLFFYPNCISSAFSSYNI